MNKKEKVKKFIDELETLSRKHGITIDGCGCCDSPYLIFIDDNNNNEQYGYSITNSKDIYFNGLHWKLKK